MKDSDFPASAAACQAWASRLREELSRKVRSGWAGLERIKRLALAA